MIDTQIGVIQVKYLGIEFSVKNMPELDPGFIPFGPWSHAYLEGADRPLDIAVERENGKISVYHTRIRSEEYEEANYRYIERLIKFLLWSIGGFRIYIFGCDKLASRIRAEYSAYGARKFDVRFMEDVYDQPFEVVTCTKDNFPAANEKAIRIGGHLGGCRIGFDAGCSKRKVSAVIDGKSVYSEGVAWHPSDAEDPRYHFDEIVKSFKTAASKMPRVDAIGISSAGVFIGKSPMVSSLFLKVPKDKRDLVRSIYERAAKQIGDVPVAVANDGDVTALAGAMSMQKGNVMGISMGTSEAVGYVNMDRNILGWLNELAFAPVDLNENAAADEWSEDIGVGCKYFSQDAVIKLAPAAGIVLDDKLSKPEKLNEVHKLAESGSAPALAIYRSIGVYLAHTISLYNDFYDIHYLIVLGGVTYGIGGEIIIDTCNRVLDEEYPEIAGKICVMLPDDNMRRVGQSIAAASLPEVN